jgi:hypothetical protein
MKVSGVGCQVSAHPPGAEAASLIDKETLKKRISNHEYRMSKEGILSITINTIDRAQRFNPSKFVIRYFAVLRFAVQPSRWPEKRPV